MNVIIDIVFLICSVIRTPRTQPLCPHFLRSSTHCAALGTASLDRAVSTVPKIAISR